MRRAALLLLVLLAVGCCRPRVCPQVEVPPEPRLETAELPETATPEQTQEAMTRDLTRWVGHARQLRELLRPYEAKKPPEKK